MAYKLPKLPKDIAIGLPKVMPTLDFRRWWKRHVEETEAALNGLQEANDAIVDILVQLGLVEVTADGALALAQSAINPGGTIKDDKVLTQSVIPDGITVPWYVASSTIINFPSSPAIQDILSTSFDKDIAESDIEVESQIELFGGDAVNLDITCQILDASMAEVQIKGYRMQIDGNADTNMPTLFKFIFQGIPAGSYTAKIRGARFNANTCNTENEYFIAIREFKR